MLQNVKSKVVPLLQIVIFTQTVTKPGGKIFFPRTEAFWTPASYLTWPESSHSVEKLHFSEHLSMPNTKTPPFHFIISSGCFLSLKTIGRNSLGLEHFLSSPSYTGALRGKKKKTHVVEIFLPCWGSPSPSTLSVPPRTKYLVSELRRNHDQNLTMIFGRKILSLGLKVKLVLWFY